MTTDEKVKSDMNANEEVWLNWGSQSPIDGSEFEYRGVRYTVVNVLGKGGQAISVLVSNESGEDCVFKVYFESDTKAAQKELRAAKKIRSTRCAKIYDFLESKGNVYGLIYEYIEGRTLKQIIKEKDHGLSSEDIQKICIDILLALDDLHQQNLVHRDITPGNIVVLPNNREARLIDFGLTTSTNAQTRMGFGTEYYMSPERWNLSPASSAMDIYGFSATMLEVFVLNIQNCLTGSGPGHSAGPFSYRGIPIDVLESLDGLARSLVSQIEKGMKFEPIDRPRSAADFAELIEQAADIGPIDGTEVENPTVEGLLNVRIGSAGVLAGADRFAELTKVSTKLEDLLLPRIAKGELDIVFLSGNPGDGKTSFIRLLERHLLGIGGKFTTDERVTGWEISLGAMTFGAIFDASESVDGVSSNDRIRALLAKSEQEGFTAVIAVNDGRLDSFLRDFSDEFEFGHDIRRQLRGHEPSDARKLLVDLKRRALVSSGAQSGLGLRNLSAFTSEKLWEKCNECLSRVVCPILENARDLGRNEVQVSIEELMTVSHLRRQRRATFRDIRSVFAYLITGDMTCRKVHSARKEGRDLRRGRNSRFYDLAFNGDAQDHLIASWSELDPALLPLSGVGRVAARQRELVDRITGESQLSSLARKVFFNVASEAYGEVPSGEVRLYRHYEDYRSQLISPTKRTKTATLLGISKVVGAIGFSEAGVAIRAGNLRTDWTVLKVIEESEFEVVAGISSEVEYLEASPDKLTLRHNATGIELGLSLDSFELLLRAAEGEVLADSYSDAFIKEVEGFASQLRDVRSTSVSVIDPIGSAVLAVEQNGQIELVRQ
jgi:serine/threonine protein kinase